MKRKVSIVFAGGLLAFLIGTVVPARADVTFEWAVVGDEGNPADTNYAPYAYGTVNYTFRIAKYEVTNAQYVEFLTAQAATNGDATALYHTDMADDAARGGSTRSGSGTVGDPYVYAVKVNFADKPVNYVNKYDAMRFVNWLHNGQGSGDTETGAYDISEGDFAVRQADALFWLPSLDEWQKAAYYDPRTEAEGGPPTGTNYWFYPTQSDATPTKASATVSGDVSNPGANVVNYNNWADWNGADGNVTTVGSAGAVSYYGLYDAAGNVSEWSEAERPAAPTTGATLGGSYSANYLQGLSAAKTGGVRWQCDASHSGSWPSCPDHSARQRHGRRHTVRCVDR